MANDDRTRVLGRVDETGQAFLATDQFRDRWEDGTQVNHVTVEKVDDRWMLRIRGKRSFLRCRTVMTPLDVDAEGALRLSSAEDSLTDSCSGTLCSSCSFAYEGGLPKCTCNDLFGWCNHTTTTLTEIPEILTILKA